MPSTSQTTCSAGSFRRRIDAFPVASSAASIHSGSIDAANRSSPPRGPVFSSSAQISSSHPIDSTLIDKALERHRSLARSTAAGRSRDPKSVTTTAITRQPVDSSSLSSIGYLEDPGVLEIEFVNGSIYRYEDVGVDVFARLASAESKGAFFNAEIRGRFRFRRAT
ncbi:MAG: KTSC domain-containing protein [Deltaproteobacteria bacterium]